MSSMSKELDKVSAHGVLAARSRIERLARRTPLDHSRVLSRHLDNQAMLKMESLQHTGSFKFRGAANILSSLSDKERIQGVVAPTAGNHGLGLAAAGEQLKIPVHIYLPQSADPSKVETIRAYGAKLTFFQDIEEARLAALESAKNSGLRFVSAYNEAAMINAGGTVCLEILEDMPDVDVILVCTGGGGLVSGIGTIAKAIAPKVKVWGIQSENSPTFIEWLKTKRPEPLDLQPSIAEGISGTIEPDTITFPIIQDCVDRVLPVSETEIAQAMHWMLEHHAQVVEPSGAAAVAGALRYRDELMHKKVVAVVTGRNIAADRYQMILNELRS